MDWLLTPPTSTRSAPPVKPPLETRDPLAYPDCVAPRNRLSAYVKLSELLLKVAEKTGPGGGGGGGAVTVRFTVAGGEVRVPSETTATHARMCRCEQLVPPIQPLG